MTRFLIRLAPAVLTGLLLLTVRSAAALPAVSDPLARDIRDIRGVVTMALPPGVSYGATAFVLFASLLWMMRRIGRLHRDPRAVVRKEFLRLRSIAADGRPLQQYYAQAASLVRRAIGLRYAFDSTVLTSEEILSRLEGIGVRPDVAHTLQDLFSRSDRVAFSGYRPSPDDWWQFLQLAGAIILSPEAENSDASGNHGRGSRLP